MTREDAQKIDTQGLRKLYGHDSAAKALLDQWASLERPRQEVTVDRALVQATKTGASRAEVVAVFKALAAYGCGEFIVGRGGHKSRFRWEYRCNEVAKVARGGALQIKPLDVDEVEDDNGEDDQERAGEVREHRFWLHRDFPVDLVLPADLTPDEAERLSKLVGALA